MVDIVDMGHIKIKDSTHFLLRKIVNQKNYTENKVHSNDDIIKEALKKIEEVK